MLGERIANRLLENFSIVVPEVILAVVAGDESSGLANALRWILSEASLTVWRALRRSRVGARFIPSSALKTEPAPPDPTARLRLPQVVAIQQCRLQRLSARGIDRGGIHASGIKIAQPLLVARRAGCGRGIEYCSLALQIGVRQFGESFPHDIGSAAGSRFLILQTTPVA